MRAHVSQGLSGGGLGEDTGPAGRHTGLASGGMPSYPVLRPLSHAPVPWEASP